MRINSHAHIFNLHSVLTRHAVTVMVNRIRDRGVPPFVADAVERFLDEQVRRPEFLVEEELLARLLGFISESRTFQDFLSGRPGLPVEVRFLGSGLRGLELSALRAGLDRLSSLFDDGVSPKTTISDVYETLRLAMLPNIVSVADEILGHMEDGDGIVALMMDVTSEETAEKDSDLFLAQLKGTSDAAIAWPGRIFPFVAVNTRRPDHFDHMRRAIEEFGFVGVKLYPSLGSPVDSPDMFKVYDYCLAEDIPILLHSTATGFYESMETTGMSNPDFWWNILRDRGGLRVCFAHFGGTSEGLLTPEGPQSGQWPHTIQELMRQFEQVYADVSFHAEQMAGPEEEASYLSWLRALLADPEIGSRVIFGTDTWLLRLSLSDSHFWSWFEANLTDAEMRQIAEEAPRHFLGLPDAAGHGLLPNIRRMADFLAEQPAVGSEPASWLREATGIDFTVRQTNPAWTSDNHAHMLTHAFFKRYMKPLHRKLTFEEAGSLRLRQLTYYNREQVREPVFRRDCRAVGIALASLAAGSGGAFEGSYDSNSAVDRLADFVADGEKSLADSGAMVDAIFRFAAELAGQQGRH